MKDKKFLVAIVAGIYMFCWDITHRGYTGISRLQGALPGKTASRQQHHDLFTGMETVQHLGFPFSRKKDIIQINKIFLSIFFLH